MRNSEEVVDFLTAYNEVNHFCDGDTNCLVEKYNAGDERIRAAFKKTHYSWWIIRLAIGGNEEFLVSPVSEEFIHAWRAYEENFKYLVTNFMPTEKLALPKDHVLDSTDEWDLADRFSKDRESIIDHFLAYGKGFFRKEHDSYREGQGELEKFFLNRIDKRKVLRRAFLLPEVFIPTQLAAKNEPSGRHDIRYENVTGLMNYLRETQKAFYLGADFAALIMMRSLLEELLRYYPGYFSLAESSEYSGAITLDRLIDACEVDLPNDVPIAALHRLRKLANDLVHQGGQQRTRKLLANPWKYECEMRGFFLNFRSLIENIPK